MAGIFQIREIDLLAGGLMVCIWTYSFDAQQGINKEGANRLFFKGLGVILGTWASVDCLVWKDSTVPVSVPDSKPTPAQIVVEAWNQDWLLFVSNGVVVSYELEFLKLK